MYDHRIDESIKNVLDRREIGEMKKELEKYGDCRKYCKDNGIEETALSNATHIAWATGGSLLPENIKNEYLNTYKKE